MSKLKDITDKLLEETKAIEEKLETSENAVKRVEATLIVNYGPSGHCIPGLIKGDEPAAVMLESVLRHYHDKLTSAIKPESKKWDNLTYVHKEDLRKKHPEEWRILYREKFGSEP